LLKICLISSFGGGLEERGYTYSVPATPFVGTEGATDIDSGKPIGTVVFCYSIVIQMQST